MTDHENNIVLPNENCLEGNIEKTERQEPSHSGSEGYGEGRKRRSSVFDLKRFERTLPNHLFSSLNEIFSQKPAGYDNSPFGRRMIIPKRPYNVWKPVRYLISSVYRPKEILPRLEMDDQPDSIHHFGRFDIGHPTGCDSVIADDPAANSQAEFAKGHCSTLPSESCENPPVNRQLSQKSKLFDHSSCHGRVMLRKRPIFMEKDRLNQITTYPLNPPVLIRINVSGTKFHVVHSTLQKDPYVYGKMVEDAMWLPDGREYYFERDPNVFRFIHNYLRSGELHLPGGICGPLLERELDDWGIPLGLDIQRCCLGSVMDTKSKLESLQKFESQLAQKRVKPVCWIKSPRWQRFREAVWTVIDNTPGWTKSEAPRAIPDFCNKPNGDLLSNKSHPMLKRSSPSLDNMLSRAEPHTNKSAVSTTDSAGIILQQQLSERDSKDVNSLHTRTTLIRWFRRLYVAYETLIVTFAVIIFMLSTVTEYRDPLKIDSSDAATKNGSSESISYPNPAYHDRSTEFTIPKRWLLNMDIFFSIAITVDVLTRMFFCPTLKTWFWSVYTFIDLLSLIPFYCEMVLYEVIFTQTFEQTRSWLIWFMGVEQYVVLLKLFVVLRLFRILRRHTGTRVLLYTFRTTFIDVGIVILLILEASLFFGTAIYFMDDNFSNIPLGSYWALITMSTVGYGDLTPSRTSGYFVAIACVILGTMLIAYMVPILVNRFLLYYDHSEQLAMLKQLHRTAKRKARHRNLSKYAQKALAGAKEFVNATFTSAMGKMNVNNAFTLKFPGVRSKTELFKSHEAP
ncbi:unnamed protein product [Calicophoron daubneyi]|uniref:Uncharacterized protein n=1 Tax=Calicophoron daubneyi TaxID=300641 RepID=A0AAV2TFY9_CALDB